MLANARNHSYNRGEVTVALERMAIKEAFPALGLGSIGPMLRPESDQAWDHTPEYKGFRPMLGMG